MAAAVAATAADEAGSHVYGAQGAALETEVARLEGEGAVLRGQVVTQEEGHRTEMGAREVAAAKAAAKMTATWRSRLIAANNATRDLGEGERDTLHTRGYTTTTTYLLLTTTTTATTTSRLPRHGGPRVAVQDRRTGGWWWWWYNVLCVL